MKRLQMGRVGVDSGDEVMFSDFEDGGPMWAGTGDRIVRREVRFGTAFASAPTVQVALSMWDMDNKAFARVDVSATRITAAGFMLVFKTWGDTRIARARVSWLAIGELTGEDDWDVE